MSKLIALFLLVLTCSVLGGCGGGGGEEPAAGPSRFDQDRFDESRWND